MLISVLKRLHNAFIALYSCLPIGHCLQLLNTIYGELVISRHQKNSFQCLVYSVGHLTNLSVNLGVDMNEIFKK